MRRKHELQYILNHLCHGLCQYFVNFMLTLKPSATSIKTSLNSYFSLRNVLQNCFKKTRFFVIKLKIFTFSTIRFGSNFVSTWSKHVSRNFRLPSSEFATVARKSFNNKFIVNIDFLIGHSMLPLPWLLTLTLEV